MSLAALAAHVPFELACNCPHAPYANGWHCFLIPRSGREVSGPHLFIRGISLCGIWLTPDSMLSPRCIPVHPEGFACPECFRLAFDSELPSLPF